MGCWLLRKVTVKADCRDKLNHAAAFFSLSLTSGCFSRHQSWQIHWGSAETVVRPIVWPGSQKQRMKRACTVVTMIHVLKVNGGTEAERWAIWMQSTLAASLLPCPVVGTSELPINICPIRYMALCEWKELYWAFVRECPVLTFLLCRYGPWWLIGSFHRIVVAFKSGSYKKKKKSQKRAEIDQGHNVLDETDWNPWTTKRGFFSSLII